ncbi:MAG TPA: N-6 DNA methylase [Nitrosospira sp.]|nr:N-6 DNA methylase [Nitrosospira sp.]
MLKEFYTTLVDEQIRHDLGEYYTPDWLAQRVLDSVHYEGDLDSTVLDPSCGSGTFLLECINRIRARADAAGTERQKLLRILLSRVKGMDLNPLAVISARANFILAAADLIFSVGDDLELPIYLADCINVPVKSRAEDGLEVLTFPLDTELGRKTFEIPNILIETKVLGKVLLSCEDAINEGRSESSFLAAIRGISAVKQNLDVRVESRLSNLFQIVSGLEQQKWNRIWCRIIKNSFSPNGFIDQVDFLVGNPPWVRWSRLPVFYRERVKDFCNYYGLVSGRGYTGGIETDISTVVLYSAADHWLKRGGKIGLLITWTVFKSGSARGFRLGSLPGDAGLRMTALSDLRSIQPFPDATNETSIYLATKVGATKDAKFKSIPTETWTPKGSGRINPRASLTSVLDSVSITQGFAFPVSDWGSPLWTGDKSRFDESRNLQGRSPYLDNAHRGTISDLARVYWVKVEKYASETNRALIRTLTVDEFSGATEIEPTKAAWIEADLLHPLIRGRDLGRYCFETDQWYQIIPNTHYENVDDEETFAATRPLAFAYFSKYKELLLKRSTYRRFQKHLPFYVIYCVGDYSFKKWKVAWMEQQDPASFRCAVVADQPPSALPHKVVVPDHKLYFIDAESKNEAHYVAAYLNSHPVRTWLGGFLHGKQIATTIFEFMRVPKFDPEDPNHVRISEISLQAHKTRTKNFSTKPLSEEYEKELAELVRAVAWTRQTGSASFVKGKP